jgi:lipopolysaccharide heptosyltransferase II
MLKLKDLNPEKILVVNPFGIGDVLFTTPFLKNLRHHLPDCHIGYVGNRRTAPLLEAHEDVDTVYVYERDEFDSLYKTSKWRFYREVYGFINEIKRRRYDVVFDFSLNPMINALTFLGRIPRRVGFNYRNRGRFLTEKIAFRSFEGRHVVEFYLDLLEAVGLPPQSRALNMNVPPADQQWAEDFLKETKPGRLKIGIIPGAGASWGVDARFRRWQIDKYSALADKIVAKYDAQIILMGDSSEKDLCSGIAKNNPGNTTQAFGRTSLMQLAALIARCDAVVLNDGGPLHIAVAVGTKTVSIFGPVDQRVYGPWGDPARHVVVCADIICRPCYRNFRMALCGHISCLQRIQVNDVLLKLESFL